MKNATRTEVKLEESIVSLFVERPELCGFTVTVEGGLVLSDVGIYPAGRPEELRLICEEIRAALVEVIEQAPEARDLLAGRTFARSLH
jgi:hypothetical protein